MYHLKKLTYLPRKSPKYNKIPGIEMCTKEYSMLPVFDMKIETKFTSTSSNNIKLPEKPVFLTRKTHGYSKPSNVHVYTQKSSFVDQNCPLRGTSLRSNFQPPTTLPKKLENYPRHEHQRACIHAFSGEKVMLNQQNVLLTMKYSKQYPPIQGHSMMPKKQQTYPPKKSRKYSKKLKARDSSIKGPLLPKKSSETLQLQAKSLSINTVSKLSVAPLDVIPRRFPRYTKNLSFRTLTDEQVLKTKPSFRIQEPFPILTSKYKSIQQPRAVAELVAKQKLHPISKQQLSDAEKTKFPISVQTCKFPQKGVDESDDYWDDDALYELHYGAPLQEGEPKTRLITKQTTESVLNQLREVKLFSDDQEHMLKRGRKTEETIEYIDSLHLSDACPGSSVYEPPRYKGMMVKGFHTDLETRLSSVKRKEKEWITSGISEREPSFRTEVPEKDEKISLEDKEKDQLLREEKERKGKRKEGKEKEVEGKEGEEGVGKEGEEEVRKEGEEEVRKEGEGEGEEEEGKEEKDILRTGEEGEDVETREREKIVSEAVEGSVVSVDNISDINIASKSYENMLAEYKEHIDHKPLTSIPSASEIEYSEKATIKEISELVDTSKMVSPEDRSVEKKKYVKRSSMSDIEIQSEQLKGLAASREVQSLESMHETGKLVFGEDDKLPKEVTETGEVTLSALDKGSREVSAEDREKGEFQESADATSKGKFESAEVDTTSKESADGEKPPEAPSEQSVGAETPSEQSVGADAEAPSEQPVGDDVKTPSELPPPADVDTAGSMAKESFTAADSDKIKNLLQPPLPRVRESASGEISSHDILDSENASESRLDMSKSERKSTAKKATKSKILKSKGEESLDQLSVDEKKSKTSKKQAKRQLAKLRVIIPPETEKNVIKPEDSELTFKKREKKQLQDPEYVRDFIFQRRSIVTREKKIEVKKLLSETYVLKEPCSIEKKSIEQSDEELELSEESLASHSEVPSQESLFPEEQDFMQQKKISMVLNKDFERASSKRKIFVKLDSYTIDPERFQKSLLKLKVVQMFDSLQALQPHPPKPEDVTEFITNQHEDGKISEEEYKILKETVEDSYELAPKVEPEVTPGQVVKPLGKQEKVKVVEKEKVLEKKVKSKRISKRMVSKLRTKVEKKKITAIPSEECRRKFNWVAEQMRLLNELRIIHELTEPYIFSYYVNWPVMSDFANPKKKLKKDPTK